MKEERNGDIFVKLFGENSDTNDGEANKQLGRWEDCGGRNRSGAAGRITQKTILNDVPTAELTHIHVS